MNSRPSISVIIPVHNGRHHLAQAVESVLSQEDAAVELIVVDDGSTDGSANVARGYPAVKCLHQSNRGAAAARNAGVAASRGELLAFLDADDVWANGKLRVQLESLERAADLDGVLGHVRQFISPEVSDALRASLRCDEEPRPAFLPSALLIRRSAFDRVGPFDETLRLGEGVDWFARAAEKGLKFLMLDRIVFHRRLHETNQGRTRLHHRADYARVMKAALDRRRRLSASTTIDPSKERP